MLLLSYLGAFSLVSYLPNKILVLPSAIGFVACTDEGTGWQMPDARRWVSQQVSEESSSRYNISHRLQQLCARLDHTTLQNGLDDVPERRVL